MKFCLDNANIEFVKEALDLYNIDQFSMNPSVAMRDLKGNGKTFFESLEELCDTIGEKTEFHVQTVGETSEEIVKDAKAIMDHCAGPKTYVKVCAFPEGYKAMRILRDKGYNVNATAIASVTQFLLSLHAGATKLAIYVNRLESIAGDGIQVIRECSDIVRARDLKDIVVAGASIKTPLQVERSAAAGANTCAIDIGVLRACASHPVSDGSVRQFVSDWEILYGEGKRVYNL